MDTIRSSSAVYPTETLPLWMRRALRGADWSLPLIITFALIAASPFFFITNTPAGTSFERYAFRAADIVEAWRDGQLYPRWTDEALGGYGAPIAQFTPPLPGMATAAIDLTLIGNAATSVSLTFTLALVGAGLAVYGWLAPRCGAPSALTASILYLFTPFIGYSIPHALGDLSLALVAALLPALLWRTDRLCRRQQPRDLPITAAVVAALWLTAPPFAAIGVAFSGVVLLLAPPPKRGPMWLKWAASYSLGTLIAAFFWLPAMAEQAGVQWLLPEISPNWAVQLGALFALPPGSDPSALANPVLFSVGVAPAALALVALLTVWRTSAQQRRFFALILLATLTAGLAVALVPSATQLLVPFSLGLAASAVIPIAQLAKRAPNFARALPMAVCALCLGSVVMPWLSWDARSTFTEEATFTSADQVRFEQRGYGQATVAIGQPVPTTLAAGFPRAPLLIRSYLSGSANHAAVLEGTAQVGTIESGAHLLRLQVTTVTSTLLQVNLAPFAGWSADFNGQPIALSSTADSPLYTVRLAANQNGELTIRLGITPIRSLAWVLAGAAAMALAALVIIWRAHATPPPLDAPILLVAEARLFAMLAFGLAGLLALPILAPDYALLLGWRSPGGSGLAATRPLNLLSDVGIELIAISPYRAALVAGQTLDLTLYWRTVRPLDAAYRTQIGLRDRATGRITSLSAIRHPGHLPSSRWVPRRYIADSWALPLLPAIPPGTYDVVLSAFSCAETCDTRQAITFFDGTGNPIGSVITLPWAITLGAAK